MSNETNRVCSPLRDPRQIVACEDVARVCEGEPNGADGGYVLTFPKGTASPPDRETCFSVARSAGRFEWRLLPRGSEGILRPSAPPASASLASVIILTSVEQARREILNSPEPVWVIMGSTYCAPCHVMRAKMAKANSAGGMKARVAYIDYDVGEGAEIIRALGLRERANATNGIPKLFRLGRGRGKAKSRMTLYELYPERFKGIDVKRDRDAYRNRRFSVWDEIIARIADGGDGR